MAARGKKTEPHDDREAFSEWVILELMGHRRRAGKLTEQQIAGAGFLRLEIPAFEGFHRYDNDGHDCVACNCRPPAPATTEFYQPSSVYAIHPVSEEVARKTASISVFQPVSRFEFPQLQGGPQRDPREVAGGWEGAMRFPGDLAHEQELGL